MPKMGKNQGCKGWVSKFWFALEYNDQRTVRTMINNGANADHVFKELGHRRHGQTPLCIAISKNNKDLVRLLVNSGGNLEHRDSFGNTPLFSALQKSKLSMIQHLVTLGANVHHCNRKHDNAMHIAVKCGRKDLVEYFLTQGVSIDVVNHEGATPLLLALELYENSFSSKISTRQSSPSSIKDIICALIPHSSSLNQLHPNKGSALRIALNVESTNTAESLFMTKLLLQHGAIPDRLFFLRFGGLLAYNTPPGAEFFTEQFFNLAILAGANLQREKTWLITVLFEMPEELQPHQELFCNFFERCNHPLSLQTLGQIAIRRHLGGKLWKKIDQLPLPLTLRDSLKLQMIPP